MTTAPHIPGAEIADARLREIIALSQKNWRIMCHSVELRCMATELLAAREALAARIVPEGVQRLIDHLTLIETDPMWDAHVEVSKTTIKTVRQALQRLAASPAANVPPQVNEAVIGYITDVGLALLRKGRPSTVLATADYIPETNRHAVYASPSPGIATAGAWVSGMRNLGTKRLVHKLRYGPYVNSITKEAADMIDALSALPPQPVEVTEEMEPPYKNLPLGEQVDFLEECLRTTRAWCGVWKRKAEAATRPSGDGIRAGVKK